MDGQKVITKETQSLWRKQAHKPSFEIQGFTHLIDVGYTGLGWRLAVWCGSAHGLGPDGAGGPTCLHGSMRTTKRLIFGLLSLTRLKKNSDTQMLFEYRSSQQFHKKYEF